MVIQQLLACVGKARQLRALDFAFGLGFGQEGLKSAPQFLPSVEPGVVKRECRGDRPRQILALSLPLVESSQQGLSFEAIARLSQLIQNTLQAEKFRWLGQGRQPPPFPFPFV
ncbi:MAG: hypothetical protein HC857_13835 [Synechococcales cyanobacterium RU_4_20]|nr:hypothetical protein [Synechococcales cyanobacterium RU_4_20]